MIKGIDIGLQVAHEFARTPTSILCVSQHAARLHEAFEDHDANLRLAFDGIQRVPRQVRLRTTHKRLALNSSTSRFFSYELR